MIRQGWTSVVNKGLRPVNDPQSSKKLFVDPKYRDAGFWPEGENSEVVVIHFGEAGTEFTQNYGNAKALVSLDRTFYDMSLLNDMEFVTITAASSPEGSTAENEALAVSRALAFKNYLAKRYPYVDRDRILTFSAGEDWRGLRNMIEADLNTPGREDALRLLNSPLAGDDLRTRLREIAGGVTYEYISEHMFPVLRGGAACMIHFKEGTRPR
jgi:hypothetical protein